MEITGKNSDGSFTAQAGFPAQFDRELWRAKRLAAKHGGIVRFVFNDIPIAVAADTDLGLMERVFFSRKSGDVSQIGPTPDPATTPQYDHGIIDVDI